MLIKPSLFTMSSTGLITSLVLLAQLCFGFVNAVPQAAGSLAQYPQYDCGSDQAAVFCQSFIQDATGLTLIASAEAAGGVANGNVTVDPQRQTLLYKAGRIGGQLFEIEAKALDAFDGNDFYYEALLRPFANSTTDRETLYLTLKTADSDRYYAAGFKVGSSVYTSKVELATVQDNQVQVLTEKPMPIVLGAQDDVDGQWYLLRFERRQGTIKVYLNSELLLTDNSIGSTPLQQPGIWSYNRSFELDYLRVGKGVISTPHIDVRLHENQPLVGYQHEQSKRINWQVAGGAASDLDIINLTPGQIALQQQDGAFIVQYLQPGQASVILQSKTQRHIFKQLYFSVLPALTFPAQTAPALRNAVYPAPQSTVPADTLLKLHVGQDFAIANSGAVRIYQLEKGQPARLIDEINVGMQSDAIGSSRDHKYRSLNRQLIWRSGNTLLIKPHNNRLQPEKRYQIVMSAGLIAMPAKASEFYGIGLDANWTFQVKPLPVAKAVMRIAPDAAADFDTLQGALNFVMNADDGNKVRRLELLPGVFHEPLYLYGAENLTIAGAGVTATEIEFSNYDSLNSGLGQGFEIIAGHSAGGRSVFLIEDVAHLVLKNLSIKNLHQRREGVRNQAETVYFNSSGKLVALDSQFVSEQDTLMLKGTSYFYRCLIAGNVDFIWGQNYLSLFEQNEIRSLGNSVKNPDSEYAEGSYILQARTISAEAPGFIFINNRFTSYPGPTGNLIRPGSTFLARSAGRAVYVDNVLMLNNQLGSHIAAQGWAGPVDHEPVANPAVPGILSGWREYGSRDLAGKGLELSARKYGRTLTAEEVPFSDSKAILQRYWPDFDYAVLTEK